MKYQIPVSVLVLSVFCFLVGCSDSTKLRGLVACSGTVVMKGNPVEEASITFIPKNSGSGLRAAAAITDAQGRFTLTTLTPQDGIMPGEYAVTVIKNEFFGPQLPPQPDGYGGTYTPQRSQRNILPAQYESAAKTPLAVTISSKGNKELEIDLGE